MTTTEGVVLAVHTADCAGVLLVGTGPDPATGEPVTVIGAVHAGWKGLRDGVLQHTVDVMRRLGAEHLDWDLGPCISAAAYEFGETDLDVLADRYGDAVRSTTLDGAPALDLRAAVRAAAAEAGLDPTSVPHGGAVHRVGRGLLLVARPAGHRPPGRGGLDGPRRHRPDEGRVTPG